MRNAFASMGPMMRLEGPATGPLFGTQRFHRSIPDRFLGCELRSTTNAVENDKIGFGVRLSVADVIYDEVSVPMLRLSRFRSAAR